MMKNKIRFFIMVGIMVFLCIGLIYQHSQSKEDSIEKELYKIILKADRTWGEVSIKSQKANMYYEEAGYAYENQDYKSVESNCRLARDYYLEESQGYKRIKSKITSFDVKDNLIDIYVNCLSLIIESTNNMYEACEYFESTARYYDKYFYTDVKYDDISYDMGTVELENHNEKIKGRDISIEKYNQCLEDFKVELNKRLENAS